MLKINYLRRNPDHNEPKSVISEPFDPEQFDYALSRLVQDDAFGEVQREKRFRSRAEKRPDFVYAMNYNRAYGYISRNPDVKEFFGSSLLVPKREASVMEIDISFHAETDIDYGYGSKITGYKDAPNKRTVADGLSSRTKRKIQDKMLAFYRASSGKKGWRSGVVNFSFVTLTFIDEVTDRQGIKILDLFLDQLRNKYGLFNYIWVAERQGNGRIHFHLVADKKFPIAYINSLWINQQMGEGLHNWDAEFSLMDQHSCTFEDLHSEKMFALAQKYLNPVDAKSIKTIDGISCYLTNYVTKNDSKIDGSHWRCSQSISKLFTGQLIRQEVFEYSCNPAFNMLVNRITGQVYEAKPYYGEYCTISYIYNKSRFKKFLSNLELINKYILRISGTDELDREQVIDAVRVGKIDYRKEFFNNISEN